jgi:hypothetical protein
MERKVNHLRQMTTIETIARRKTLTRAQIRIKNQQRESERLELRGARARPAGGRAVAAPRHGRGGHCTDSGFSAPSSRPRRRQRFVAERRRMIDIAKVQQEDLSVLRRERNGLRARTFPSFARAPFPRSRTCASCTRAATPASRRRLQRRRRRRRRRRRAAERARRHGRRGAAAQQLRRRERARPAAAAAVAGLREAAVVFHAQAAALLHAARCWLLTCCLLRARRPRRWWELLGRAPVARRGHRGRHNAAP